MIKATYIGHMGNDLSVVNAARVSFGNKSEWDYEESDGYSFKQHLSERDRKLIHYLARHRHTSPFGHCFISCHVRAPVFVARQLQKHKFLRWNEISRRYTTENIEFYTPDVWRGRSEDKKQGSEGEVKLDDWSLEVADNAYESGGYTGSALGVYSCLLKQGVCPEQARMVLPQSTMTEWYWSGSLDAFIDMCNLRCKEDTQYETRLVADYIKVEMIKLFPISVEALVS